MRCCPAIGVHNNLATRQPGITIRTTNDEIAGRINKKIIRTDHPAIWQDISNHGCNQLADVGLACRGGMLCRQHDLVCARGAALIIIDKCDLAF